MKANTYVVKPFGISEVKVIALKGDPGTPTQEQVNTAVDEYMTEHPEAQIPDGSITEQKLSSDVVATLNDVDNKADKVGSYPDLIAGTADNLLSSSYQTDRTPYLLRRTPYGARERGSIVGGSIVWNQLEQGRTASSTVYGITFSYSDGLWTFSGTCTKPTIAFRLSDNNKPIQTGHKILLTNTSSTFKVRLQGFVPSTSESTPRERILEARDGAVNDMVVMGFNMNGVAVNETDRFGIFDLTLMFGPTIADYIYTQEQATAGAGVALAKAWAGITADYYPYDAGSIKSVTGLTAHKMTDGNGDIIGEYPLDSSLTLRGLPKLDGDNLYYDGDIYKADGTVERKYGIVDLGTLNWGLYSTPAKHIFRADRTKLPSGSALEPANTTPANVICPMYTVMGYGPITANDHGRMAIGGSRIVIIDHNYSDAADFKAAMSGVMLVYELATPITESAEPYTALQICDPAGTEEFVGASMPVGHETKYYADLKGKIEDIPDAPSTNGTYVLKATVSSSGVTYEWIAG